MKKLLCLFLALFLLIPLSVFSASADDPATSEEGFLYTVTDGEVTLTGHENKSASELSLPEEIDGYPVTTIGEAAFYHFDELTSVTLPHGLTTLEDYAFKDCEKLEAITLPDSVTSVGERAFHGCEKLESVTLSKGLTVIETATFFLCERLKEIEIPEGVTTIKEEAFSSCSALQTVFLPESLTTIESSAFSPCLALSKVSYAGSEKQWEAVEIGQKNHALERATVFRKVDSLQQGSSDSGFSPLAILAFAIFLVGGGVHLAQKH